MAGASPSLLRRQLVAIGAAIAIGALGAVVWSRTVADDGDTVVLDEPGEFVDPASTNVAQTGNPLPAFDLVDAAGVVVRLEPDGRPLVVNLWYSTCPPCARELTAFAEVEGEFGADVRFVGVNPYDTADDMVQFADDRGVRYQLLRDLDFAVADQLGVVQFPVTLFVNADGEIVTQTGALSKADLRDHVTELLA